MKKFWLGALMAVALLAGGGKFAYDYFFFDIEKRDAIEAAKFASTNPSRPAIPSIPSIPLNQLIEIPTPAPPAPSASEVQQALINLGIPAGEVDGKWGQRTRQGFCIWRELTGREVNRNLPMEIEARAIVNAENFQRTYQGYKALTIPSDFVVGLNISKTCQSAVWIKDKSRENYKVTIVSTGAPGLETGDGVFKVSWRVDRWYESIAYPDGWMYRPMFFNAGEAIHGSEYDTWVWWYPASHGCVRMLGKDIDELWASGFGTGSKVYVYGDWNPNTNDPT